LSVGPQLVPRTLNIKTKQTTNKSRIVTPLLNGATAVPRISTPGCLFETEAGHQGVTKVAAVVLKAGADVIKHTVGVNMQCFGGLCRSRVPHRDSSRY